MIILVFLLLTFYKSGCLTEVARSVHVVYDLTDKKCHSSMFLIIIELGSGYLILVGGGKIWGLELFLD